MKSETAKQLQAMLDARNKENRDARAQAVERQSAEAKNLEDFAAKKETVIKPAFQEIVELYRSNGVTLRIVEEDERPNERGGLQSASVELDTSTLYSRRDLKPRFALSFNKRDRSLTLFLATSSSSGSDGDVPLDDISADWIQDAFLKYQSRKF